jgi:hypothetical protein
MAVQLKGYKPRPNAMQRPCHMNPGMKATREGLLNKKAFYMDSPGCYTFP